MNALKMEPAANQALSLLESKAMLAALNQGTGTQHYRLWSEAESLLLVVAERTIIGIALSYAVTGDHVTPASRLTAIKMIAETMSRKIGDDK